MAYGTIHYIPLEYPLFEAIKLDIVEIGLASHVEKFLIEMGAGFAFMGRQYHIEVSGDDYSRDSLPTIEEIEKELEMKQFSNKFFKEPNLYLQKYKEDG